MVGLHPLLRRRSGYLVAVVAVALVAFAFWRALFAGGSLVSHDFVALQPPFDSYQADSFSLEAGPGDPILIHAHWGSLADDVRSGDVGWWDRDIAGGQPTMKGGLPPFNLFYLLAPVWFAPGLVAAVRALTAIGLTFGFLRAIELRRVPALIGGLAYGFSGFMVGWMNWPQSSVAALAPGLLWAIERGIRSPALWRAVPLAAVVAAMVWSNFPQVTLYVMLGGAVYGVARGVGEWPHTTGSTAVRLRRWLGPGAVAVGLAALLASPHLIAFSDYLDWADTTHRNTGVSDSSAGVGSLLTSVAPWIYGSDAGGPAWFGPGNWTEFQIHIGASVVVLGFLGLAAGLIGRDRRLRSVTAGVAVMVVIGIMIGYVGGPIGVFLGDVVGDQGGLMTRAKVLISLGVAILAAVGADALIADRQTGDRAAFARIVTGAALLLAVVGLGLLPSLSRWFDQAQALGLTRQLLERSTVPMIAFVATVAVIAARWRGLLTAAASGVVLVAVVAFELLSFAMPVPTIVDRSERLEATPAHDQVRRLLDPGERLSGEGGTFFAGTTAHFGIDDARGQTLKSPGFQALLRAVDPAMLSVDGGTPTNPNIVIGTDPTSPVWDAMAVGVWSMYPSSPVPGALLAPTGGSAPADPAIQPVTGQVVVPEGGLRAVVLEILAMGAGTVQVTVSAVDGEVLADDQVGVAPADTGLLTVPMTLEHVAPGTSLDVRITAEGEPGLFATTVDDAGSLVVGSIAGGDGLRLVRTGDVLLLERLDASFARLYSSAIVVPDPSDAARAVAARTLPGQAVVSFDVGLSESAVAGARLEVRDIDISADRTVVTVETDRDSLLVVSQVAYPGWSATVDGQPAEIVVADAAFTGVRVPAGSHEISFSFRPENLLVSLVLAGLGVVIAALLFDHERRARAPRQPGPIA